MWFSVIHQQESAMGTSMYLPDLPSIPLSHLPPHPTLQPVTEPLFKFPESYSMERVTWKFTVQYVK